ncbi:hypothetical protein [Nonomuraea sp. NPDC001699]
MDDRAGSHPAGQPHIFPEGNNFRFTMHTVDRDTMTDRQRQEVTGTGSWTAWASKSIAADLVAGANTIRLTATAAGGCPNLDYLEVLQ